VDTSPEAEGCIDERFDDVRADNKSESALIQTALAKSGAARSPKRRSNAQEYWL
jgi:hypothetical protein